MPTSKQLHKFSSAALAHLDELLDEALKETFPASDAIAINIELEAAGGGRVQAPQSLLSAQEHSSDRSGRVLKSNSSEILRGENVQGRRSRDLEF